MLLSDFRHHLEILNILGSMMLVHFVHLLVVLLKIYKS